MRRLSFVVPSNWTRWRAEFSVENLVHLFRRTGDHGSIPPHAHGPVHYFGVSQQQHDQGVGRIVVFNVDPEIAKRSRVNEIDGIALEQIQKSPQDLFAGRGLQIFDDVELDVAVAENLQRTVGLASFGVVVDGDFFHR